jgi:glycosyltransferase involved in cell wall biosynthesis
MRVVIDLQACQHGAARDGAAVLAHVRALLAARGPHEIIVVLYSRPAAPLETLRHALADLLPPPALLTCSIPAIATPWERHAAESLRLGFLASLEPDLLYLPGLYDTPATEALTAVPPGVSIVYGLATPAVLDSVDGQARAALHKADLLVSLAPLDGTAAPVPMLATADDAPSCTRLLEAWSALVRPTLPRAAATRPRLALVSPLPPERSGIADYSAELLELLDAHYDITLVVTPGAVPDARLQRFPRLEPTAFSAQAARFERVLYHFGNSNYHKHMFGLLARHPGIVVLHDFYLSGVLDNMERDGDQAGAFLQALYASHGYSGLHQHAQLGRNPTIWAYPCNWPVLEQASGVIVHSEFARRLASHWYGENSAAAWQVVPLLRTGATLPGREGARAALGLQADDYVVSSFGMLGRIKLNERLLQAFLASPLAADPHCHLVFVGENDAGSYGAELAQAIAASPAAARIRITGFASADDYARWLAASDCAVQLRSQTRGESSASILDCLLHGLPTIINAHGAAADLPEQVLVKLPDGFRDAALADALGALHADPAERARLRQAARDFVRHEHGPQAVGERYRAAIEHLATHGRQARYRELLRTLAQPGTPAPPSEAALIECARLIAANRAPLGPRQLLIDISALVQTDYRTGIQRVVRSILLALVAAPPPGYRIEPVFSEGAQRGYRYARNFTCAMLGVPAPDLEDAPIDTRAGDLFLGLDLASNITTQNEGALRDMRARGVHVVFCVYDLLPLLRPDCFPFGTEKHYGDYLDCITSLADGIVTISRAVCDELAAWLEQRPSRRASPLRLGWFHLGADLDASAPTRGLPPEADSVLAALAAAPGFLTVGTLEPRKGQAQTLAACEQLWDAGVAVNLVIVGKSGWLVEPLVKRLQNHPQAGKRLFWLPGVSDEMLDRLYASCAALLAPSEGEGFGLPLIEAAQHGLPVIARDIPVFREVAGEHAYYFSGTAPEALAAALRSWLDLHAAGQAPQSKDMPWLTWSGSARQITDVVLGGRWYRRHEPHAPAAQLLVDVSAVAREDLRTGIQRVVRAQLLELMRLQTTRFRVLPVYLTDEGQRWHYRYARRFEHTLHGTDPYGVVDEDVEVRAGDVFYSPDFFPGAVSEAARTGLYQRWRSAGVSINFLIHDLLPVLKPEFFPPGADDVFRAWLQAVAASSDRLLCISQAVADEARAWLERSGMHVPQLPVLHHGADLDASSPSTGLPPDADSVLADLASVPTFLMVGTIEPRKGHLQALDAFEQLWAEGADLRLAIVGGEGWKGLPDSARRTIPAILKRLGGHPELGRRLHWLRGISDEYLDRVYQASACLLVPSEGEGFGLPLIEAARHGLPVLARDLPVFREVAGAHAAWFSGSSGEALAGAVRNWLQRQAGPGVPDSSGMGSRTWADNARALAGILFPGALNGATPAPLPHSSEEVSHER